MLESPAQQAELMASLSLPADDAQPELAIDAPPESTPTDLATNDGTETALTSHE
jgi:hypothetical protein